MKFSEVQKYRKQLSFNEKKELTTNELLHVMEKKGLILSNFYQELEMDNVAVSAHQDVNDTKDVVQLHSHTYYEILYCKSGNIQYLLGADRYRLRRGDIVFIPPGISHRPLYLDKLTEPYSRYVIWIAPDFVQKIQSSTPFKLLSDPVLLRTQDSGWEYLKEYSDSLLGGRNQTGAFFSLPLFCCCPASYPFKQSLYAQQNTGVSY